MEADDPIDLLAPVVDCGAEDVQEGIALCLSGGGYRAMLFHVGALWRLNELGFLPKLDRVSSVSGGSITAATLAVSWGSLEFSADNVAGGFEPLLVRPIRALAGVTIDRDAILGGILTPRRTISDKVTSAYRRHLFGHATLQQLPDQPRFVINSTNLQTGTLWRFSKPYMADYTIGVLPNPAVELAVAVAASSAFPPFLSPLRLRVDPTSFSPESRGANFRQPLNAEIVLSDGGVYDNLGLETAWKPCATILISDGGGQMTAEPRVAGDWARQAIRVNAVIDNQVRDLRKRQAIAAFERSDRAGTYWGMRSHIEAYGPPPGSLLCPPDRTAALAATKTRLKAIDATLQERLINWGYAVCDAAMRRWLVPNAEPPEGFPYAAAGVG